MTVRNIKLRHYRNFLSAELVPSEYTTVLYGLNGAGKTNIVEAVHLCAVGRSHRPVKDHELILRGQDAAAVTVNSLRHDGTHEVSVRLFANEPKKKQILLNGKAPRRLGEMMGHVTCVIFSPEDLDLIKGGPSCRRRFMDMLLCQQSAAYFYELQKYIASLSQRNALLRSVKGNAGHSAVKMLPVWEEQLQKAGAMIIETRMVFAEALEKLVTEHYRYLCGPDREAIVLRYRASTDKKADIKAALSEGFDKTRAEDIKRGITTFGPHREDIILTLEGRDMRTFASQGQIRAAALSMKLSEISLLTRKHAEAPILLLDDVMSELDMKRRALLMDFIKGIQTIVTCTDASDFPEGKTDMRLHVVAAKNGGATLETV